MLKDIWFTTLSGRSILYKNAEIIENKARVKCDDGTEVTLIECWSESKSMSAELRVEMLLEQIAEWGAAITRSEVIINRLDKAQHRIDVETENGFTPEPKTQDTVPETATQHPASTS